jgi:hypothetical protein
MFRSLAVSTLVLGSALALVQPQVAAARDRDDRNWRAEERRERREFRERERWRHHYRAGYYDRFGYWHWYYR